MDTHTTLGGVGTRTVRPLRPRRVVPGSTPAPAAGGAAFWAAVFGAAFLVWYLSTDVVPSDFTKMAPYVTTLLVLALASQRLRMPKADGLVYRRGSAG